jgi:ATP-dependent helicase/DNAse subunit B
VTSLSASKIEDYLTCPFIFAAKSLFRLSDLPSLDLDVDASTRGKLVHALFERLTREPMVFEYTRAELERVVDLAREQAALQVYDERLWPSMRQRYAETARQFLAFEREWRARFPETSTLDREVSIEGFVDPQTGELTRDGDAEKIRFTGSIDRVDIDRSGHAAIIDYKSSPTGSVQWTKWIENDDLRLLLYSIAYERGLTKQEAGQVVSAVYYVARTMDRDKGFKVDDIEQGLYATDDRKQNKISLEAKGRLFTEVRQSLSQAVTRMRTGEFAPVPKSKDTCRTCQWSSVCRAPHLNI